MFKRLLCLAIALVMVMGIAVVAASAAQVELTDDAADTAAEVGAADEGADVGAEADADTGASGNTFSFDATTSGWNNYEYIAFHIWGDDETFADWGSRKQRGTDTDGDNVWTYDLDANGVSLNSSKQYYVIFYSSTGVQTYNLICGTACYGDTGYCTGNSIENPVDSEKTAAEAKWRNQDASVYGPELAITSIGNVVGSACPASKSPYSMFVTFLKDTLTNARSFSGKDDHALIDDVASKLGLYKGDVTAAIAEAGVDVDWDESKSSLTDGTNPDAKTTPGGGTSSSSSTTSSSGSSGGSSGGSSSSSGSASSSTTGQETTVLYIMLGVMVVAAGVIFFLRRRERA